MNIDNGQPCKNKKKSYSNPLQLIECTLHSISEATASQRSDLLAKSKFFERMSTYMSSSDKREASKLLLQQTMRKPFTSLEAKRKKERGYVANDFLKILFGEDNLNVNEGIEYIINKTRKKTGTKIFLKNQDQINEIQQRHFKVAAELYIRWRITSRKYKIARELMKSKTAGSLTLAETTMGIEMFPSLRVLMPIITCLRNEIEKQPVMIRERGNDGRFHWIEGGTSTRKRKGTYSSSIDQPPSKQ